MGECISAPLVQKFHPRRPVPKTLYRLSGESLLQRMERENSKAAANQPRLVAHLLSERVSHLVTTVTALER